MRLFAGWVVAAGVVLATGASQAQSVHPIGIPSGDTVFDVEGPYAAMPPETAVRRYGPMLLPAAEVYTVVRESGFSPLGIPQQRGLIYTISVIDHGGDDGRLIIDARTGRIIRFVLARRAGDHFDDDLTDTYGPVGALPPMPPPTRVRSAPRPPKPIPQVAARTVPLPKPNPLSVKPGLAAAQQAAAAQPKLAEPQAVPPTEASTVGQARPAPVIRPTQEMPVVQGLE